MRYPTGLNLDVQSHQSSQNFPFPIFVVIHQLCIYATPQSSPAGYTLFIFKQAKKKGGGGPPSTEIHDNNDDANENVQITAERKGGSQRGEG